MLTKNLAQTTSTLDWFSLSNVSSFKDFRDLANRNLTSIQESQSVQNNTDVEFVEVNPTKRPNGKNNDQKLTLPKIYKLGPSDIKLKNKFEPLARLNDQNDTAPSQTAFIKVPPIYLEADNSQEVIRDLNKITNSEFIIKQCFKKIKILLVSTEDFRKVTKCYDEGHINYFTFVNQEERPLSVAMQGKEGID
jgi:hypothetical protein